MVEFKEVYPPKFFREHLTGERMTDSIKFGEKVGKFFHPKSVIDVGMGSGGVLRGIKNVCPEARCDGLDHPEAGVQLDFGIVFGIDLNQDPLKLDTVYGLAICTEVGEHLPASRSWALVHFLTKLSDRIIWTAAFPGQGGTGHVNEQPKEYWKSFFEKERFVEDMITSDSINVGSSYPTARFYERIIVYVKEDKGMKDESEL